MFIFDQFKKHDPYLHMMALSVLAGLGVLLAGLWWVQIVSARDYQANLETQSFRTVRIPAVRGRILDRNGVPLAENRATYNASLYLADLRKPFDTAAAQEIGRARRELKRQLEAQEHKHKRKLTKEEKKPFLLTPQAKAQLREQASYEVASNVVVQIGQRMGQPVLLDPTNFLRHYQTRLALPYPVLTNLNALQIARFEEQSLSPLGFDLEVQSTRVYPQNTAAAHVLGYVQRDDSSAEGEEAFFSYRLPDYRGRVGIEAGYDKQLRGKAGAKSVRVNSLGYRQTENIWSPAEPGQNVVLTIDLKLQQAAERALPVFGPSTRGAIVVMDVESGDLLAMASSPGLNPNHSIQGYPPGEWQRRQDPKLRPQINRATQENYAPGSIFKTVVGLACLEGGLDPSETIFNSGHILVGKRPIKDLAPVGHYDFRKALMHSSNTYFITNGLRIGIERIVRLGQVFHLGERTGLQTRQEVAGTFPDLKRINSHWYDGDTANLCIGQGQMAVTPLQMAVMTAAIANGGKVLSPRLVDRVEPQDPASGVQPVVFPRGQVRNELGVKPRNLQIVREAMLADVEDPGGTGVRAAVPGLRICGKTGTAQVMNEGNKVTGDTIWFVSFAPYEKPHYAVVVMIEVESGSGTSGGSTCAPVARNMYRAILERETKAAPKSGSLAGTR